MSIIGNYKVTWWTDMSDNTTAVTGFSPTLKGAFALVEHGPPKWERYLIEEGDRFIERGDPAGPRGAPAKERYELPASIGD